MNTFFRRCATSDAVTWEPNGQERDSSHTSKSDENTTNCICEARTRMGLQGISAKVRYSLCWAPSSCASRSEHVTVFVWDRSSRTPPARTRFTLQFEADSMHTHCRAWRKCLRRLCCAPSICIQAVPLTGDAPSHAVAGNLI